MDTERRLHPRITEPLPVIVRGSDSSRKRYQFDCVTRDLSAGGLCARAPRRMAPGEKINLHIRFAAAGSDVSEAPAASARAVVVRSELCADGDCMFAASFFIRHMR
ncbi:MAG TPA: PilZ domain-containing protein [Acidobacteriota bacterium]|nr:PilZ domain-containing protein [Acidobacteriota bacterium]